MSETIEETFAPAGVDWQQVSPKLTLARWISWSIVIPFVIAAVIFLLVIPGIVGFAPYLAGAAGAFAYGWGLWFIARRTKSWAYAERADDLIVTRGFMFKRLVIVPYGRMQLVDVGAGPIDRYFGIASLQLHTAAATSDAVIPGLTPDVAGALRDRLARLGEERAAGL
ncbi:MAG: membrane protein YdbS with pleckstrin-like domain [Actinomycetes bacterium]|jgi:membrane protein YdbS with pleckstrin-like domain